MTVEKFIQSCATYPEYLCLYFALTPIIAYLIGIFIKNKTRIARPFQYAYTALVYLASIPGILAGILLFYQLLFHHQNILGLNILIYFLPPISMAVTLFTINKRVKLQYLPGCDRLWGGFVLISVVFFILLAIYKTRIFIGFFGSLESLVVVGIFIFALLKWSAKKLLK